MRIGLWLVFVFGGVVVGVTGATLLSGTARFLVICVGVVLVALAPYRGEQQLPGG